MVFTFPYICVIVKIILYTFLTFFDNPICFWHIWDSNETFSTYISLRKYLKCCFLIFLLSYLRILGYKCYKYVSDFCVFPTRSTLLKMRRKFCPFLKKFCFFIKLELKLSFCEIFFFLEKWTKLSPHFSQYRRGFINYILLMDT